MRNKAFLHRCLTRTTLGVLAAPAGALHDLSSMGSERTPSPLDSGRGRHQSIFAAQKPLGDPLAFGNLHLDVRGQLAHDRLVLLARVDPEDIDLVQQLDDERGHQPNPGTHKNRIERACDGRQDRNRGDHGAHGLFQAYTHDDPKAGRDDL